jgi:hypothetical protein
MKSVSAFLAIGGALCGCDVGSSPSTQSAVLVDAAAADVDSSSSAPDAGSVRDRQIDASAIAFPELGFASQAAARIEGNWSNARQAAADTSYNYGDIRLQICRVALPNLGAAVFYQQTSDGYARRRLLSLLPNAAGFELKSYGLKADPLYANWCTQAKRLPLTESDLKDLSPCMITYTYLTDSDEFRGAAPAPKGCDSTFQGAVRLEVDEWFAKDQIRIWERWYDAADKQVAGAPKGPYLYDRIP